MKHLIIIFLLLVSYASFGQNVKIDSLEKVLKTKKLNKEEQLNTLFFLSAYLLQEDKNQEAKPIIEKAIKIARSIKSDRHLGSLYLNYAVLLKISDYDKAELYYQKSLKIQKQFNDKEFIATCLSGIANLYIERGRLDTAMVLYNESLKIEEELDNPQNYAISLTNIGRIYNDIEQYGEARKYNFEALKIFEHIQNNYAIGHVHNELAVNYMSENKREKAFYHYQKSVEILEKNGYARKASLSMTGLGSCYYFDGNYEDAQKYYEKAYQIQTKHNDMINLGVTANHLGDVYISLLNSKKARYYVKQALEIAKKNDRKFSVAQAYLNLTRIDSLDGNFQSALQNYRIYRKLEKEIQKQETKDKINQLQIQYETEKKDKELLKQKNQIQQDKIENQELNLFNLLLGRDKERLELVNLEKENKLIQSEKLKRETELQNGILSKEKALSEAEVKRKKQELTQEKRLKEKEQFQKILGMSLAGLFLFLVLIIFWNNHRVRKAKKEIENQKEEIAQQNEELEQRNEFIVKQNKEIEKQNETIEFLSGDQNHMIDNLLRGLENNIIYQDKHKSIEELEQENKLRINSVIAYNKLLNLEIIEQKQNKIQIKPQPLFEKIIKNAQTALKMENIQFILDVKLDWISSKRMLYMTRILNESIINACKYAYKNIENPEFRVSLQENAEQEIEFILSDNGIGVNKDTKIRKNSRGSIIIEEATQKMNGKLETFTDNGTTHKITFA